ncbi:hypothetical protein GUJ93_ZPchr0005g16168 [Zizania palustris]|uniref:Uncharacterized protein n=1 Tax=Zizania palustris TaxID=103762 RepID=A0A8J5W081_ZIZPA|nr:hypothetical protein GUJ93_ZPchr0005g16168 [Zizania palustris]
MACTKGKEEREEVLVKEEGSKLYSKMVSKEAAATLAVPSFRVYYGVASAGSVPFLWESQPGTPKRSAPSAAALPPLTPPPSYYVAGGKGDKKKDAYRRRWYGGGGVWGAILPSWRGRRTSPSSSSSSSSSYSSSSSMSMSPVFTVHQASPMARSHRRALSAGGYGYEAPAAARCFGMERECERGLIKGCGVTAAVRNALATVVGHKSGR